MSDFRITSLEAKYVGPFEHLSIEFKEKPEAQKDEAEVHIFTGENGTGKSTILYLLTAYPNTLLIRPRVQLEYSDEFNIQISYSLDKLRIGQLRVNVDNESGFLSAAIPNFLQEYLDFRKPTLNYKYSFALFTYSGLRKINNPKLESIKEIDEHPLFDALNFNSSAKPDVFIQWIANVKTEEALAVLNNDTNRANRYSLHLVKVQEAISSIIGSIIEFELTGGPLNVFVKWNGVRVPFEVLPDGLKSIISWLGDLLRRMYSLQWKDDIDIFDRNFILFLDEIDVHLHPAWQRKILPVIKKLFKNAQIFISTHSPFVIGSVDGAWVYKLKKEGRYAVLDGEPVLSEDAKSYRLILEEIFGIKEQFGENVEKKLDEFYLLRNEILEGKRAMDDDAFNKLVAELVPQSIELESIIAMELKQLERIKRAKQLQPAL